MPTGIIDGEEFEYTVLDATAFTYGAATSAVSYIYRKIF